LKLKHTNQPKRTNTFITIHKLNQRLPFFPQLTHPPT